jgi:uncharacterized protein YkwD/LysM repeat protein
MRKITYFLIPFAILALLIGVFPFNPQHIALAQEADTQTPEQVTEEPPSSMPSPAEIIEAVNNLRIAQGLNVLRVNPILMQVAALQASALAVSEGAIGHQRPCGMTLGQQLLSMGFPLLGDLTLDGYRSENWVAASTKEEAISFWLSDAEHTNTMESDHRSDIGAAVAVGDQIYIVLETALSTGSGQMQYGASSILTGIPMTTTVCAGFASGDLSDYSIPIAISTARPDGDVVHKVEYGQTLWSLATMYHVSIEQIKLLNGLVDDNIVPGWKLLIQKAATQPPPMTDTPLGAVTGSTSTATTYPTAIPFHTTTPTVTATVQMESLGQQIKQNKTVGVALLIAFSVLLAGIIGFGKKKEE